jgi:5'-deoxynucleotidase YfbR-like HD superfamily hydrolase
MLRKNQPQINHVTNDGSLIDFSQEKVNISLIDCLTGIALENRYHNRIPWTVLLHSIVVGKVAVALYENNVPLIQKAFCHDLQEAVIRDVPTPIKNAIGNAWYNVEDMIQQKIFTALGIDARISGSDEALVNEIDKAVGYTEAVYFFDFESEIVQKLSEDVKGVDPKVLTQSAMEFSDVVKNVHMYITEESEVTIDTISLFRNIISLRVN